LPAILQAHHIGGVSDSVMIAPENLVPYIPELA
jgi:hypothetical protein